MKKLGIAGGAFVVVLVLAALAGGFRRLQHAHRFPAAPPASTQATATSPTSPAPQLTEARPGFLFGRVTTIDGATYEGRLRFGGDQEAFWGDYFNGRKGENPWATYVPADRLPKEWHATRIFGFRVGPARQRPMDLTRLLMARLGDIARIQAQGREVRVTLKSGTMIPLQRMEASDFDDGLRVWDGRRGVVDLDSLRIRTIEFLPTAPLAGAPGRLHGTVRTRTGGELTGFIQWDRWKGTGDDTLDGRTVSGKLGVRFDTVRSIARRPSFGALVTLRDGREIVALKIQRGDGFHGVYVDDRRYGRVLVPWEAFERIDFNAADSGPAYGDYPAGRPLGGSVTTRDGKRLAGRLVFDLDESETTETLDAPAEGVDYTIPFGLVASIVLPAGAERASVTLQSGETLQLERQGDLGAKNAGLLVFVDNAKQAEYVSWKDVARVDLDRPPAMYPPLHEPAP